MSIRNIVKGRATQDGAGVKLRRSLGATPHARMDPFLMLDEFYSDDPNDYIAGFPSHSHCGFETITYILEECIRHEDHRSEEHTSELQSRLDLVCRLLLG